MTFPSAIILKLSVATCPYLDYEVKDSVVRTLDTPKVSLPTRYRSPFAHLFTQGPRSTSL